MTIFGLLTNIFFYESQRILFNDFELKKTKMDLVNIVNQFIQNTSDHDYMTEGLRVLANLTKNKEVCKYLIGKEIH